MESYQQADMQMSLSEEVGIRSTGTAEEQSMAHPDRDDLRASQRREAVSLISSI